MTSSGEDLARLDRRDREYVATLDPGQREVVVSTIVRHQRESLVGTGARVPELELHRLDDGTLVRLPELLHRRPLVLVFGSFT